MTTRLWPALAIRFTPSTSTERTAIEDLVSAALDDLHPTAIQERDADWLAFFAKPEDRDRAAAALPAAVAGSIEVDAVDVADEDWARRSQQDLDAVRVGRIIIAPPWRAANASLLASATPASTGTAPSVIVIQPSMGFGTGHHASTRLCTSLLQRLDLAGRTVLDVGTGSGAIALAIADEFPDCEVTATDTSPRALEVARANAERLGLADRVRFLDGSTPDGETFDLIVANLPYVAEADWAFLQPEVTQWEPREALLAGPDGLDAIRALLLDLERTSSRDPGTSAFAPGGAIALEVGEGQAAVIADLLGEAGFGSVEARTDLAGIERIVTGER